MHLRLLSFGISLLLLISGPQLQAQDMHQISFDVAQNMTTFSFKDSNGNKDNNYRYKFSNAFTIGYQYEKMIGLLLGAKLGMRKAGASYTYDNMNYDWSLQYTELRFVVGYNYPFEKLGIQFTTEPYFSYLIAANQRLNNENFNMLQAESISNIDYGLFFSPGINYKVTPVVLMKLQINYMLGLGNLETDADQTSKNNAIGASLGVLIQLNK